MIHPQPDFSQMHPAHSYPTDYLKSYSEIEILQKGHGHMCGIGKRTGLTIEDWPVYELTSFRCTPELNGWLVALTPNGFTLHRRASS